MSEYRESPNLVISLVLDDGKLPGDMKVWLAGNIDPIIDENAPGILAEGETWWATVKEYQGSRPSLVTFRFKTRDQAILFKLTWGGM